MLLLPLMPLVLWLAACIAPDEPASLASRGKLVVATVQVAPDTMTLWKGEAGIATCLPRNKSGATLTNGCVWVSKDTTIARVSGSQTASITAIKAGSVLVVASAGGKADTLRLAVKDTTTIPPPPPGCVGVAVAPPPASIQSAMNANPGGTTFCLSAGTYNQTVVAKAGDVLVGSRDVDGTRLTTLNGAGTMQYAFTGAVTGFEVRGLRVCNYVPALSNGAIFLYNSTNVRVIDNEICNNRPGAGTDVWTGWLIRGNWIHDNGQLGITGQADGVGATIDTNDVSYNNTGATPTDPNCCAGGIKTVRQTSLTVRGNYLHHNNGPGVWCDYCLTGNLVRGNTIEDNTFPGVMYEASHAGRIDSNAVRRNGASNRGGIWVDNSDNVDVSYNTVIGPSPSGLILLRQVNYNLDRTLHDVSVHHNTVTMAAGEYTGCVQFITGSYCSGSLFNFNRYTQPSSTTANFRWSANSSITRTAWQAAGQDPTGTFAP